MSAPLAGPPRSLGSPEAAAASGAERAAWALGAAGLLLVLFLHLVPGLVAGLLTHLLLRRLTRHLTGWRVTHSLAKLLAAVAVATLVVLAMSLTVLLVGAFVHGRWGGLPALLARMAQVVDDTSTWLESRGIPALWPDEGRDASQLKEVIAGWLRGHGEGLRRVGGEVGRGVLHAAVGIAVGVMVFFRHPGERETGPLASALTGQARRFTEAFDTVVLAQVRISAINTVLTALYLLALLPLLGVRLPLRSTLVVLTFLTGLLPVLGNLLSNTVIVLISFGVAGWVAALSLAFLVVIHKLEYLVNARIVGARIDAAAWEILLALFVFEAAFGIPGVVLAPIVYADVKGQLRERGLV
jgi:predicted PurR-regulated permease PerM